MKKITTIFLIILFAVCITSHIAHAYRVCNLRNPAETIYTEVNVTKSDDSEERYMRCSNFFLGYGAEFDDADIKIIDQIVNMFSMPHNTLVGMQEDVGAAHISYVRFEDGEKLPYIQLDTEKWAGMTDQEKRFVLAHEASHYVLGHLDSAPRDYGWFARCRVQFGDNTLTQVGFWLFLGSLYALFDLIEAQPLLTTRAALLLGGMCGGSCWLIASEFNELQAQEKEADLYAVTKLNSITGGMEFFEHEPWNASAAFLCDVLCLTVHPSHAKRARCLQEWRNSKMSH